MSHRVHTILSLLAEDHAPAALRPSILLAVDWPTVAEEAPATGDDASAAAIAHLRIQNIITSNHHTTAPLAARLATVAVALASSGDKAMATHATALWGAAAALAGMPTAAPISDRDHLSALAAKAADIVPGAKCSTPNEQATLIGTALDRVRDMKPTHDKALADIHALRDILKVPEGGNLVDIADAVMRDCEYHRRENARLRAQVDRMIAAMREDAPAPKAESVTPIIDRWMTSTPETLVGAWMVLMTGPLGNNGARWSLETTVGNHNNLRIRWPSGCETMLKDPR